MLGLILGIVFSASFISAAALGSDMLIWIALILIGILAVVGFYLDRAKQVKTMLICTLLISPIYIVGSFLAYGYGMLWVTLLATGALSVILMLVHLFNSWKD